MALAMVVFASVSVSAQRTISGTVTDTEGEPLIGANVLEAGTSNGTITDIDGTYSISVADDATLLFSFTGFASQQVAVGSSDNIDVALSAGEILEEVVVTGYGTQKAREITSSIASVKAEDFNKGNVNDPTQLLQGKVAGLAISKPGSNPNGSFNIRLRGLSTIGASTEPLVVIDGALGGDLNSVDPNDIASIDVLKDGSAAAIYGTRGASGVILITTKRGSAGTSTVEYNGQVSLETVDRFVDILTPDEYRAFGGGNDRGGSTEWYEELTTNAISHVHNLSLAGGSQNTTYRVAANYRDIEGIAKPTGFEKINVRANLTQRALNDKLTVSANVASSIDDGNLGFNEAFRYATIFNPTTPFIRDVNRNDFARWDGYYQEVLFDYYNPVAIIEQNVRENKQKNLAANLRGDYNITDELRFSMFYSYQRQNTDFGEYFSKFSFWTGENRNGLAQRRNDEAEDQLFRIEARYEKTLANNIDFRVLAGYEYQDFAFQGFNAQGGDFLTDAFSYNNLSAAQDFANGLGSIDSYKNTSKLISFFGRVNLNFDDKFFVTASVRQDGSSRFGANEKWGLFPAVSAGVDLAEVADLGGFDQLKFRVGYGVTGNNVGIDLLSLQRFGPTGNFFFNGAFTSSFGPVSNPNPDLRWETKTDYNIGIDFAALDYRLTGSVEYYNSTTEDGIFEFSVPVPPNLFGSTFLNIGEVNNDGIELALGYNIGLGDGKTYQIDFTASKWFVPTLVSLTDPVSGIGLQGASVQQNNLGSPGQNGTPLHLLAEGQPLGQLYALVIDPDNPLNDDGTWNFVDVDGDGRQDDLLDRDVVGNGFPDYQIGFNNTFNLGAWDVNVFFRGVFGHDLLNTFRAFYEAPNVISSYNILASSADIANLTDQPQLSSRHIEKGDFFRLDNMTVGYTLDEGTLPSGFRRIRLYLTAQNVFTISGYTGVSPEPRFVDANSGNALWPGVDRRNEYFSSRAFTFGVNLGF